MKIFSIRWVKTCLFSIFLLLPTLVFAEPAIAPGASAVLTNASDLAGVFLKTFTFMIYPILFLIGALLDNTLIFGPGAEDRILEIWSYVRNMVNLLLGVFLVGAAIYNLSGVAEDGNYAIKTLLPKLLLTIILVNFSFIGTKVVLDVTNVISTASFALPNTLFQVDSITKQKIEDDICSTLGMFKSSATVTSAGASAKPLLGDMGNLCENGQFTEKGRSFFETFKSSNLPVIMAANFGQISRNLDVSNLVARQPSIQNILSNLLVSLLLTVTHIIVYLMLFFIVLVRLAMLYILIAISPLLVVSAIMGQNLPGDFSSVLDRVYSDFMKYATQPIIIGVGLSISYMMFDALSRVGSSAPGLGLGADFEAIFPGGTTLHELIIGIGSVVVAYKVAEQAAQGTVADSIVQPLRDFAISNAGRLRRLPLTFKAVPGPKGSKQSIQDSLNTLSGGIGEILGEKPAQADKSKSSKSSRDTLRKIHTGQLNAAQLADVDKIDIQRVLKEGSITKENALLALKALKKKVRDEDLKLVQRIITSTAKLDDGEAFSKIKLQGDEGRVLDLKPSETLGGSTTKIPGLK